MADRVVEQSQHRPSEARARHSDPTRPWRCRAARPRRARRRAPTSTAGRPRPRRRCAQARARRAGPAGSPPAASSRSPTMSTRARESSRSLARSAVTFSSAVAAPPAILRCSAWRRASSTARGVRSSWLASATNWRCSRRASPSGRTARRAMTTVTRPAKTTPATPSTTRPATTSVAETKTSPWPAAATCSRRSCGTVWCSTHAIVSARAPDDDEARDEHDLSADRPGGGLQGRGLGVGLGIGEGLGARHLASTSAQPAHRAPTRYPRPRTVSTTSRSILRRR